jgi:hypothetical protein
MASYLETNFAHLHHCTATRSACHEGQGAPTPFSVALVDRGYDDNCFIVKDHNGQKLAYVYERGGAHRPKLLTKDEGAADCVSVVTKTIM